VTTRAAQRIVGAVQTVLPQHAHDFGTQQKGAFLRDAAKLAAALAEHKYLFLTTPEAFDVVCGRYRQRVEGIRVVSLADGREFFDAAATRTARL
jgi:nitrogenase molybdenum-iron protein alpha/beta subunit